jgi:hypothetical protein
MTLSKFLLHPPWPVRLTGHCERTGLDELPWNVPNPQGDFAMNLFSYAQGSSHQLTHKIQLDDMAEPRRTFQWRLRLGLQSRAIQAFTAEHTSPRPTMRLDSTALPAQATPQRQD